MKHIDLWLRLAILLGGIALLLLAWTALDTHAQGYENVCTCYRVPICWFIAEYTRDGQPGDGEWEWLPLWSDMLRRNIRTFGDGWRCSHGIGR